MSAAGDAKDLGASGEDLAAEFLRKKGYEIVCRNYRCCFGEIDIVTRRRRQLCFVEVKSRRTCSHGSPQESVGRRKQRKLSMVALEFMQRYNLLETHARFDVVAVLFSEQGHTIELIENAFDLAYP